MLDTLRRGANTLLAKILLGLLVVSFAIWGIADVFRGGSTRAVAEVGGTEIPLATFQRVYAREVQNLSRQFGQPVNYETAAQLGLPARVLGRMLSEATLTESARKLGLGVSDAALAKEISEDPSFQAAGKFDRAYFNQLLQQNGMTEAQYIADRRLFAARKQLADGLVGGIKTPAALVETLARYRNEIRIVDYVVLPPTLVQPVPTPTEEDLKTTYEANKESFRAPEYRKLKLLTLTPDALADPSTVSDEDARKEYERTKAQYGEPEKRRIQQILLPTVEDAKAASDRINGGATFEAVAAERGIKPEDLDLGLLAKSAMVDPAIADVAFTLSSNAVSEPIPARFGGALVRVTEIVPESVQPFEAVIGEVKKAIAVKAANTAVLETYEEIEDLRAGGSTLDEISQRFKLPLQTVEAVDETGKDPAGAPVELPEAQSLLPAAFQSDMDVENDPIQLQNRGSLFFEVAGVTAARDRPLDEVKADVTRRWTEERTADLLDKKADELIKSLKAGQDFAAVAAPDKLTVQTSQPFARNGQDATLGEVGVAAAFDGPEGFVTSVEGADGSRIVLRVKSAIVPPFFAEEATSVEAAKQFADELQNSLLTQYIGQMQIALGTTTNQTALQQAIGVAGR